MRTGFATAVFHVCSFGLAIVCAAPRAARAGKPPKVSTLSKCPAWGAEVRTSPRGVLNEVKRRRPTGSSPMLLDFDDIASLQRQADARVQSGPDAPVTAAERAKLRNLEVRDRRVSEGDLVSMSGFLTGKPKFNVGESVNCYVRGTANNDLHIAYAAAPRAPAHDALVAELIPQDRPKGWTVDRLKKVAADNRRILVVGQLMFDSHHKIRDEPRASLWEIHPVTALLVCQRSDNDCDPMQSAQWTPLEAVTPR